MLITAQICSLAMCTLIFVLYISNKKLNTYSRQLFKGYLISGFSCIGLTAIVTSLMQTGQYESLQALLQKTILINVLTMVLLMVLYILYETNGKERFKTVIRTWMGLYIAGIAAIIILPIQIKDNAVVYGYNYYITYGICILFLGMVFVIINHREKPVTQKKLNILNFIIVIYITGLFIEMITLKLPVIGIVNTVILICLFFQFENPLEFIDKETGLFNTPAFREYLDDCRINDKAYNILLIDTNFHNYQHTMQLKQIISEELLHQKEGAAFKHLGNVFVVVYREDIDLERKYKKISEAITGKIKQLKLGNEYLPAYLLVEDTDCSDIDSLMKFIEKFREENFLYNKSGVTARIIKGDFDKSRNAEEALALIRKAIETDNVLVFLQPIYSIQAKKHVSAEVLVRLRDLDGNIIYPGAFMEAAENSGLIIELESVILRKVCKFIKEHPLDSLGLKYLELNLSIRKGESEALTSEYKAVLNEYGIDAKYINLEITESTSMHKKDILMNNMHNLIDYGFTFSLDDFGSGESNLNYIIDMPVSIVKFDKDMTQSYFTNDKARTVIEHTLKMIHGLGLKVVAEGVETKEQLDKMTELGVDYIQGYYFSKPVSVNNFVDYIKCYEIDRNT